MDAVHRFEGTVNQVLGDGIMALFGAPIEHELIFQVRRSTMTTCQCHMRFALRVIEPGAFLRPIGALP